MEWPSSSLEFASASAEVFFDAMKFLEARARAARRPPEEQEDLA
jgi:hypothetical protein